METGAWQDPRFQERDWRAQRVGWVVLFAVLVAALLGFFGPGPLSLSRARSTDQTLQADYHRFTRSGRAGAVTVTVAPSRVHDGTADVWWNSSYLEDMRVDGVTPDPDTVTIVDGRVRYRFAAEPGGEPLTVTFNLTPGGMGATRAEVATGDGSERLTYDQFVYP